MVSADVMNSIGRRRVTLAGLALAWALACSGKSGTPPQSSAPHAAGRAGTGAGASGSGEGGFGAEGDAPARAGVGGASGGSGAGGRGGGGGLTPVGGGTAGGGARGGSAGAGTTSGAGGSSGASGASGTGWTCAAARYDDGESCDCGCGIVDPDCEDESAESCDTCRQPGSCANGSCPSNVTPDDNSACAIPDTWLCGSLYYGDGFCDCGCGVIDTDCDSQQGEACVSCPLLGCARNSCATIDPDDNTLCTSPPLTWKCNERFYRDGTRCDCGCGFPDPDCTANELDACDSCNGEGSCSGQPCPGTIDPDAIQTCIQPYPPSEWTCGPYAYGSGDSCDCGCGAPDPDCRTSTPASCEYCACNSQRCPESVDPDDTTQCAPPPPEWTCPKPWFANELCDCGCGATDIDCSSEDASYCVLCEGGCAHGHCERLEPHDNSQCSYQVPSTWTCSDDIYWDDVCDCGCGALDPDCANGAKASCDLCNSPGSCSSVPCMSPDSTILPTDNTKCSG
jgi:hypothetical protein